MKIKIILISLMLMSTAHAQSNYNGQLVNNSGQLLHILSDKEGGATVGGGGQYCDRETMKKAIQLYRSMGQGHGRDVLSSYILFCAGIVNADSGIVVPEEQ